MTPPPPRAAQTMNMYKWPALRLAFVPGIVEAVFDAGIAVALFGMPFTLALSMGFILKAVGPVRRGAARGGAWPPRGVGCVAARARV